MIDCPYGFRIVGATSEPRRLVDAAAALAGYAACDKRAQIEREAYLSAFTFGDDFPKRMDAWGVVDVKGYNSVCGSPWLWWDIDRNNNLECALGDARRLAATLVNRFKLTYDDPLILFSGSKGFHVGLPTALWLPEPSSMYHRVTRRFANSVAEDAGVVNDSGVYDRVRAFRAPNSRHPKTGLYKRRLTIDELNNYSLDRILQAAQKPEPFNVPAPTIRSDRAVADWLVAVQQAERDAEAHSQRRTAVNGAAQLNRLTLEFIANGADEGDRHRLLYSAAANLAEFGCPPALAHALLTEAALDSGLPKSEVQRQIDCGLATGSSGGSHD